MHLENKIGVAGCGSGISVSSFKAKADDYGFWQTDGRGLGKYYSSLFKQKTLGTWRIVHLNAGDCPPLFYPKIGLVMRSEQFAGGKNRDHGFPR